MENGTRPRRKSPELGAGPGDDLMWSRMNRMSRKRMIGTSLDLAVDVLRFLRHRAHISLVSRDEASFSFFFNEVDAS